MNLPAQPMRRAEDQLLRVGRGTEQLKRVIENLPMGVAIADTSFAVQYVNHAYSRLLGWTTADVSGVRLAECLFEPDERAAFALQFQHLGDPPGELVARFDALCRDGGRLPIQWQMVPLFDRKGQFDGVIAVVQDRAAEVAAQRQAQSLAHRLTVFSDAAVNYAFIMLDPDGAVSAWSRGAELLTGFGASQMIGASFVRLFSSEAVKDGMPERLIDTARRSGQVDVEAPISRRDGGAFIGAGRLYYYLGQRQHAWGDHGFALVLSDQTQARMAACRLVESEARLAAVVASASDAIVSVDVQGRVQLFNPAAERIFQVPGTEMLGHPLDRLIPDTARDSHGVQMAQFADSRVSRRAMGVGKVQGIRADGQRIDLEASISQAEVGGQTVLTAILRDVTDRLRADRALINYQIQLAGLAQRLLAQEKETTRSLAQALHDDLGQTLAAMRLIFDAGVGEIDTDVAQPRWVQRMGNLINDANRQVRRVLIELRPPLLDDEGLFAALDNELRQQQGNHDGVGFQLQWGDMAQDARWPADVEHAVFMVAREAIANALHHAAPHTLLVRVQGAPRALVLSVRDDGHGEPHIEKIIRPGHLGLVGMRERALAIGAVLEIRSSATRGTTVSLTWGIPDAPPVPDR